MRALVWWCEIKIWKKCKIRLHGYSLLKTEDIDVDIAKDVETRLYASLPKWKF